MKKEMYKKIIHATKDAEILEGIIRVAVYDNDLKLKDYDEIIDETNKIIMKERGDKK